MLPSSLYVITFDANLGRSKQFCAICMHCVEQNITRYQYFNRQQQITTDKQSLMRPNLAEVYCKNDDMALCRECDRMLHV